jgi:hypothetical protein
MALLFYFIVVYFYITHQVLVGQPQRVGGLAILFYIYFILVYFKSTHQVLLGLPQGVGGLVLLFYLILFHFSLFV